MMESARNRSNSLPVTAAGMSWCVVLVFALATTVRTGTGHGAESDGEPEYVQQLISRGMYELAEQFCERQIAASKSAEAIADWELVLSDCYRQHAWQLPQANRDSLMQLAIERITDFLEKTAVSAAQELRLRVRQIELLALPARMQFHADRSIPLSRSLQPRISAPDNSTTSESPNSAPSTSLPANRHAAELNRAEQLAVALLAQLEQLRRELDPQDVRLIRDSARLSQAEIQLGLSRIAESSAEADSRRQQADESVQQIIRTTGDSLLKFQARLLAAEIQLDAADLDTLSLRLDGVAAEATMPEQRALVQQLKVSRLLQAGQPTDALQLILDDHRTAEDFAPALTWLRMESLQAMIELVWRLNEPAAIQSTSAEFERLRKTALESIRTGVWHEAIQKLAGRFEAVRIAGPDAADQLERADALIAHEQFEQAKVEILGVLKRLPSSTLPATSAQLQLRAGELCLKVKDWPAAVLQLQQAASSFRDAGDVSRAAAADLLRVYAIGRQWEQLTERQQHVAQYENALAAHLADYPESPTTTTAREWLVRLVRDTEPVRAADELMTLYEQNPDSSARVKWLTEAGELIVSAAKAMATVSPRADSAEASSPLTVSRGVERYTKLTADVISTPELRLQAVELALLTADAKTDWNQLRMTLDALPETSGSGDFDVRLALLRLIVGVRSTLNAAASQRNTTVLMSADRDTRLSYAEFIRKHIRIGSPQPGDLLLAQAVLRLVEGINCNGTDECIRLLSLSFPASVLTGNSGPADRLVDELLKSDLSEQQILHIADILTESSASADRNRSDVSETSSSDPAGEPLPVGTQLSAISRAGTGRLQQLWQSVMRKTAQGSERWLEASLQLAALAQASGDDRQAVRMLEVVELLYPAWGTPQRKHRAQTLRRQLQEQRR